MTDVATQDSIPPRENIMASIYLKSDLVINKLTITISCSIGKKRVLNFCPKYQNIYGPIVEFIEMKCHSSRTGDFLVIHIIGAKKEVYSRTY